MQEEYSYQERKKEHRSLSINNDGLQTESTKKGKTFIPFVNIQSIRLLSPMKGVFACMIKSRDGQKFVFANRSYISLGKFDFKNNEYKAFLETLHEKTKNYHQIQHQSGSSALYWFLIISLPVLAILLITMLYLKIQYPNRMRVPYSLFGLAFVFPLIVHYLKQGKSKSYKPDKLPVKFLPQL